MPDLERHRQASRRSFLVGAAALLAGGALFGVPGSARAHETSDPPTDVDILNYALTLEHLEYAFYRDGLKMFTENDFRESDLLDSEAKESIRQTVYEYFLLIRDHEETHVDTLTEVIQSLGGTPVPEATYNFETTAFTTVEQFIAVAQLLEDTGVSLYDGAIPYIDSASLLSVSATIATVEARHASYINLVSDEDPLPVAFDEPAVPRTICENFQERNGGFIVSTPEPYGPYRDLERLCRRLPDTVAQ